VSDTVNDSTVTCPSCEYRYPRTEGTCVMCGTPPPAFEPVHLGSAMRDEFSRADDAAMSGSKNQENSSNLGLASLIAVLVVSTGLILFASFRYELSKARPRQELRPSAEIASRPGQAKSESTQSREAVHYSPREAPLAAPASLVTVEKAFAEEKNPVDLWNAVKRGSAHAEVALANLYIRGETVSQSCEQAYILLLAASMKGSKLADNVLKSTYAERCQ
jgi:hypothetical protein